METTIYQQFKNSAEAAGNTEVERYSSKAEAFGRIDQILEKEGISDLSGSFAVWAESRFVSAGDREELAAKHPGLKFDVTRESAKGARIGITWMEWGVADTGTLVQDSTAAEQRLASALPLIHIALLHTRNILSDLAAVTGVMDPSKSAYISFITGPSKTADIERVLAIGVHGPERLYILCVDEGEGGCP